MGTIYLLFHLYARAYDWGFECAEFHHAYMSDVDDGKMSVRFLLTNFDWKNISWISSSVVKIFVCTQNISADDRNGSTKSWFVSHPYAYWSTRNSIFHSFHPFCFTFTCVCAHLTHILDASSISMGLIFALSTVKRLRFSTIVLHGVLIWLSIRLRFLFNGKQSGEKWQEYTSQLIGQKENTHSYLGKGFEIYTITEWMNAKKDCRFIAEAPRVEHKITKKTKTSTTITTNAKKAERAERHARAHMLNIQMLPLRWA